MLHCVLYIFLGGTTMLGSGCVPYQGVYYADKVEYVDEYYPRGYVRYDNSPTTRYYPYNYWYSYNRSYYYPKRNNYRRYRSYKPRHTTNFRPYRHKVNYKNRPVVKIKPAPYPRYKTQPAKKKGKKKWKKR